MADFTRFDFHAYRFLHSENVKTMDTEEVGQYILLLCEAWCSGKSATLPTNPAALGRLARVEKVSDLVMAQFREVETEWGTRLENETLTKEWDAAMRRSKSASERGKKGNTVRYGTATASLQRDVSDSPAMAEPSPVSYQAVPAVTESAEQEENVSLKSRINDAAGKKVLDGRNDSDFAFLARKYGKEVLVSDFLSWYNGLSSASDIQYPGSLYLKVAESRLAGRAATEVAASDPSINEIIAFVYTLVNRAPRGVDVIKMRGQYSQEEIQDAFKAYTEPLDDYEVKFATKNFFQDGAGEGIILARRQKKIADAQQAAANSASIEAGIAARKAESDARAEKIRAEQELADRLGDAPF